MLDRSLPSVHHAVHTIASLFMAAYMTARVRALDHPSGTVRLLAQRDHCFTEAALLEREIEIFRSQRRRRPARHRPHYSPEERSQILRLMAMRGWTVRQTARRFLVHENTIRNWRRALEDKRRSERLLGEPPWNKLHDAVRWLVHELRSLCPEREFGTRSIARHIVRAGVQISRTSVRRILEEEITKPARSRCRKPLKKTTAPDHVQHPKQPNRVWHLDLTSFNVLWFGFELAAIIDGFSRRIIGLKVFTRRPTTNDVVALIRGAIADNGVKPRFLVTDHGSQFRKRFRAAMIPLGVTHVRCQLHTWHLNAKVERLFRDVKFWIVRSMLTPRAGSIQGRLDAYRAWHNTLRPHAAHGTLTPIEAERSIRLRDPVTFRQKGGPEPIIVVTRQHAGGDPRLFYPRIKVTPRFRWAA